MQCSDDGDNVDERYRVDGHGRICNYDVACLRLYAARLPGGRHARKKVFVCGCQFVTCDPCRVRQQREFNSSAKIKLDPSNSFDWCLLVHGRILHMNPVVPV